MPQGAVLCYENFGIMVSNDFLKFSLHPTSLPSSSDVNVVEQVVFPIKV